MELQVCCTNICDSQESVPVLAQGSTLIVLENICVVVFAAVECDSTDSTISPNGNVCNTGGPGEQM